MVVLPLLGSAGYMPVAMSKGWGAMGEMVNCVPSLAAAVENSSVTWRDRNG